MNYVAKSKILPLLFLVIAISWTSKISVEIIIQPGRQTLIVYLPNGKEAPQVPDPWLNGGWYLTFNETTWAFRLVIKQVDMNNECYKTHLIVALNDIAYKNILNISINGTNIPKSAFRKGVPQPFGVWTWPDDVYPAWFNDTVIQFGTIEAGDAVEIEVQVSFLNITGVRIHFDAYGKLIPCNTIPSPEQIIWSPHDKDSTVLSTLIPPVAKFYFKPDKPLENDPVIFNASESYDPDGEIFLYSWDFGDGTSYVTSDPIVLHSFAKYGNYTVSLTVIDATLINTTCSKSIHIRGMPKASFSYSPEYPCAGQNITFTAQDSVPNGGHIIKYLWNFGDGAQTVTLDPFVVYSYMKIGTYNTSLTVFDSEGLNDTIFKLIKVEPKAPTANFSCMPTTPIANQTTVIDATSSSPNGGYIVKYFWDFGDGTQTESTNPIVHHVFYRYGYYNVSLLVTDSENLTDFCWKLVHVIMYPSASFSYSQFLITNEEIIFNASMSKPNGGTILWYFWDFGDGSYLNVSYPVVSHAYTQPGKYNVTLTVYDDEGLFGSTWRFLTVVSPKSPSAYFTINPEEPVINQPITFNASLSSPGFDGVNNCSILWYFWDFGDGSYLNVSYPVVSHAYTQPGKYNVTLTVYAPSLSIHSSSYYPYGFYNVKLKVHLPVGGKAIFIDKFRIIFRYIDSIIVFLLCLAIFSLKIGKNCLKYLKGK